jgi:hypothetical protein
MAERYEKAPPQLRRWRTVHVVAIYSTPLNSREAALDPLSTQGVSPKSTSTNCASCGWPLAAVGLVHKKHNAARR